MEGIRISAGNRVLVQQSLRSRGGVRIGLRGHGGRKFE